jgi:hypothetical protein
MKSCINIHSNYNPSGAKSLNPNYRLKGAKSSWAVSE